MKTKKKIVLIVVLVLLFLSAIALALYLYQKNENSKVTIEEESETPIFELSYPDEKISLWYSDLDNPDAALSQVVIRPDELDGRTVYFADWLWEEDEHDKQWLEPGTGDPLLTEVTDQSQPDYLLSIDYRTSPITFIHRDPANSYEKEKNVEIAEGKVVDSHGFHTTFAGYDFTRSEPFAFQTIASYGGSTDGMKLTMKATNEGTETVSTPAGDIPCYKVKFQASGLLALAPGSTYRYWFRSDWPHILVQSDADGFAMQLARIDSLPEE